MSTRDEIAVWWHVVHIDHDRRLVDMLGLKSVWSIRPKLWRPFSKTRAFSLAHEIGCYVERVEIHGTETKRFEEDIWAKETDGTR